jgi:Carboxypeptidase regulatory-like domain
MPKSLTETLFMSLRRFGTLFWLGMLAFSIPAFAQGQQSSSAPQATASSTAAQQPGEQSTGTGIIMGAVVDKTGGAVSGALIKLTSGDRPAQETVADAAGQFFFANVAPGPFELTVTAQGFTTQTASGVLRAGESFTEPPITMLLATVVTEVHVSPKEEAKVELHAEEQQRVLGVVPNFYVTYVPDAAPLAPRQKFQLAWKTTIDPISIAVIGATAGFEQATNYYSGYGQGAQGYGKRLGATSANYLTSTFIGGAILPSLLKQDPRYFYRGTGSRRFRLLYALGYTFFCKGDNGRYEPNYSTLGGIFASSAIGQVYYPSTDQGVGRTFQGALIGIAGSSAANVLEEFVVSRFTSHAPHKGPSTSTP